MSNLPDNNSKQIPERNDLKANFSRIEEGGLNYIKNERNYLIMSALMPIFILIVQCINLGYIFSAPPINPSDPLPPNPVNVITPIVILIIISFFALVNFSYLINWKEKVNILY